METLLPQALGKRIEYIDALRGFTMILVVLCHVAYSCLGIDEKHAIISSVSCSGSNADVFPYQCFFCIKRGCFWNLKHIGDFLKKKFVVQILSTLFFFVLYLHLN